ncbi:hypothetical protein NX021_19550, partial [Cytobacillus firmus]|nr:hypothetical protein [Cytobacillus firmus]
HEFEENGQLDLARSRNGLNDNLGEVCNSLLLLKVPQKIKKGFRMRLFRTLFVYKLKVPEYQAPSYLICDGQINKVSHQQKACNNKEYRPIHLNFPLFILLGLKNRFVLIIPALLLYNPAIIFFTIYLLFFLTIHEINLNLVRKEV